MAEIEGLKLYISKAETARLNMAGAPEMSPQHFETLLPYAIALGEEKPWSQAMQAWLATAAAAGAAVTYAPGWYGGRSFSGAGFGSAFSGLSSTMSSAFQSSVPAPRSSSSGFSGGGSGGGGGGGGGGGW
ncbi:DUF2207 family protein [Methylobrevis pamukkalensis]|uniref:Predicted membrane protein YciQ-like C-terminal domain-containing protein n=1 Tax=Methylobrevis pamukkalensis TaxID=1439726 RepID=A0A1E3H462_9HYPH|nr:DUF2207 domain-containing protein [Methylobrevis pamukkalensis]ODN70945.1 hypothetical protein A6302_01717 [Methylobrevis pamukkalensis]